MFDNSIIFDKGGNHVISWEFLFKKFLACDVDFLSGPKEHSDDPGTGGGGGGLRDH